MYEFLDHPSEEMVRVTARSTDQVFSESAIALFEMMTDIKALREDCSYMIDLESTDRILLLIDWLNRLILLHETENVFLKTFETHVQSQPSWRIHAIAKGQKIHENLERRLHVKSATYGQLTWNETPKGHQVEFVVDV